MGIKRTPEALVKFKIAMKLKWKDPEYRRKVIQARAWYKHSEETKRKLSKAHLSVSLAQEKQIIKFYQNGLTAIEIETELGMGQSIIFGCLKRNGIRKRPIGHRKGTPSWNKGIKFSEEQKAKLNMEGLELGRAWNKGKTGIYSEEFRQKLSLRNKSRTGERAFNWKGGISYGHKTGYYSSQYKEWRKKVFERDNYICQDCGICSGNGKATYLTAHHIKSFAKHPELKFEVSNGVTLCEECHCKVDKYRARFKREVN